MNKNELDQSLSFLRKPNGELQIILYAYNEEQGVKKLDIKAEDLPALRDLFVSSIVDTIINQNDFTIVPLSSADERRNCFYEYDLDLPSELSFLHRDLSDAEYFGFDKNIFERITSLVILLADNKSEVYLYKKLSPIEVIGRGGYLLWKSNTRLERFERQLLRISPSFQVMSIKGTVVIINLETIERSFGFHDVIKREAKRGLKTIEDMHIVSNLRSLEESIDNISFARKLTKIAKSSPVIKMSIPNEKIITFSKSHPAVKGKMKYTSDGSQFVLDTKASKELFVKLLNDDFLTSELTKQCYESLAKDSIGEEKE